MFQKAGLASEQIAVDSERERLDKKAQWPWYARLAVGFWILFGALFVIAILIVVVAFIAGL